jgi:hypothetical protein
MVSIIGEILGHAAVRFGDKTALIIEGRGTCQPAMDH